MKVIVVSLYIGLTGLYYLSGLEVLHPFIGSPSIHRISQSKKNIDAYVRIH